MGKLENMIASLKAATPEVQRRAILEIAMRHEATIIDLNTAQLMNGTDSKGEPLPEYRNPMYAKLKRQLNPKGVTDLRLSGDFHGAFYAEIDGDAIDVNSHDKKTASLVERYGANIFGLTKENTEEFTKKYINQDIDDYYRGLLDV